ncbi:conserved exported hypothetical protein [Exiguobacterium sp. 8H]|uniref:hypothetical protein n=1 Tax=unclassified Exiguobacterium TaxID=2644629 RepID=UPI0012F207F1|nr:MULTISPECIES: hypothetical protein [unclassified Exiguobacterium]VXB20598.1 conserved exported hypothetical protein [Exiguobacterium sp. 8H]VXB21351.1 conserved exported hypothetical protein [Exiguobacterium sp. 8A]
MQRMTSIFICCIGLLASTTTVSAEMTESSAERFADEHFYDIVMDHIQGDDPTYYHMNDSENITFGPLLETYIPSSSCYKTGETCTFVPTKEFVATVFQDDEPVNMIGTYEQSANTYAFSTFGSDKETPKALMNVKGDLVKYTEESAWFDYDGDMLTALTSNSKQMISGDAISTEAFQTLLIEEHESIEGNAEEGMMDGADGYSDGAESNKPISSTNRLIGFAFLAMLPFGYWTYRRTKKRHSK